MTSGKPGLRRIFQIALSISVVAAGLCLMCACAGIYFSGGAEPYSREAVAAAFSPIAIPVYLCLILVAVGIVWNLISPAPDARVPALKQHTVLLRRAAARADLEACDAALREQILAERSQRKARSQACAALLIICAANFLSYALDSTHFHSSDINGSMIRAMMRLIPCLAVSIAMCVYTVYARQKSMAAETELLKQCPKKAAAAEPEKTASCGRVKYVLLVAGIALLAFGFFTGGTADVLTKAVNICTECIGLG